MRFYAIGSTVGFQLQNPHVDSHLQNHARIVFDESDIDCERVKRPVFENMVDSLFFRAPDDSR